MKLLCILSCSIVGLLIFSCTTSKKNYGDYNKLIIGSWQLVPDDQVNYPSVDFDKEFGATFYSLADTVYRFGYQFKNNVLILKNQYAVVSNNKILKLTKDSLIFEALLEKNIHQVYVRKVNSNRGVN